MRTIDANEAQDAASMFAAAGLAWIVEQWPLEAVLAIGEDGHPTARATVPGHVANVRSDTDAVLGVVDEGYGISPRIGSGSISRSSMSIHAVGPRGLLLVERQH